MSAPHPRQLRQLATKGPPWRAKCTEGKTKGRKQTLTEGLVWAPKPYSQVLQSFFISSSEYCFESVILLMKSCSSISLPKPWSFQVTSEEEGCHAIHSINCEGHQECQEQTREEFAKEPQDEKDLPTLGYQLWSCLLFESKEGNSNCLNFSKSVFRIKIKLPSILQDTENNSALTDGPGDFRFQKLHLRGPTNRQY